MSKETLKSLEGREEFTHRHIGPSADDAKSMLADIGFSSIDEMTQQVVPQNILSSKSLNIGEGITENGLLKRLRTMAEKNKVYKNYIGMGYSPCITPTVILRNVLEDPGWYTAYTPYQAEISQGRLEALLNFQTVITELTGMDISNSSLLDEGTAAAEAMAMAYAITRGKKGARFFVDENCHPHVIEVLQTRSQPIKVELVVGTPEKQDYSDCFAALFSYPNTRGEITDLTAWAESVRNSGGVSIATTDLLSLTLLKPPGEMGIDIVVGSSQRFGVPLFFGGPHAAFLATSDAHKRLVPGRIVGRSVDAQGKMALRLALQTREQHIRRERATSNICTAQVLLANMASFYAVYHGPEGLKKIAQRTHRLTQVCAQGLKKLGFSLQSDLFFDTLHVELDSSTKQRSEILSRAESSQLNLRHDHPNGLGLSLDETTTADDITELWSVFSGENQLPFTVEDIDNQCAENIPSSLQRTSPFLKQEVFQRYHSETEILRYIQRLQIKDLSLAHAMIPLGSCTMKLNATTELIPVSWPEFSQIHPFAPTTQVPGYLQLIQELEDMLADITGFTKVSLQPNAGSQGEFAGLLAIHKYHESRNEGHRHICLIPSSAHGTNPASAVMAGMKVLVVKCDEAGNIDVSDLKEKAEKNKNDLAALMITYPSTHGVFEETIKEICQIIHDNGGQVYMDGANLNALVGLCRPCEFGADVAHLNLHKTFSIPHGGGGPGIGPIGVAEHLKDFIPGHSLTPEAGPKNRTATTSAPWGSAGILPISWSYIAMMGSEGLKQATQVAILNANYIAKKLEPHFPILYKGREGLVAHECILDVRPLKKSAGVTVDDIAKRLIDYGFHAPTMSWPVAGTLMIEPTESESRQEIDRFIEAMIQIKKEAEAIEAGKYPEDDNPLRNAPHTIETVSASEWKHPYPREEAVYPAKGLRHLKYWSPVGRVDNAYGDRNLVCTCPPIEEYE